MPVWFQQWSGVAMILEGEIPEASEQRVGLIYSEDKWFVGETDSDGNQTR